MKKTLQKEIKEVDVWLKFPNSPLPLKESNCVNVTVQRMRCEKYGSFVGEKAVCCADFLAITKTSACHYCYVTVPVTLSPLFLPTRLLLVLSHSFFRFYTLSLLLLMCL